MEVLDDCNAKIWEKNLNKLDNYIEIDHILKSSYLNPVIFREGIK